MTYSLMVANKDLVQQGSVLGVVFNLDKLRQDLEMWLREDYGGDRFHPTMGTVLPEFIGQIINTELIRDVQSEVLRILQNYQKLQHKGIRQTPQLYSTAELLMSIDDVKVSVTLDTIWVTIKIRNGSGNIITVNTHTTL